MDSHTAKWHFKNYNFYGPMSCDSDLTGGLNYIVELKKNYKMYISAANLSLCD
ncbi:hypothetical protein [Cloacibacillus evryensis]|uniref:hypothetical protein n=1 Tax=Cloacibacillus evryensis TaxID=508460 RepID=UPI0002D64451|nr:hypothetical protein [Cloacibacillus evryensis]